MTSQLDVEDLVVVPVWMSLPEAVANRVVFTHEQVVQHREADPPVAYHAGVFDALVVDREREIVVQPQVAIDTSTEAILSLLIASVDL